MNPLIIPPLLVVVPAIQALHAATELVAAPQPWQIWESNYQQDPDTWRERAFAAVNKAISDLAALPPKSQRHVLLSLVAGNSHLAENARHFDCEQLDMIAIAVGTKPIVCSTYGPTQDSRGAVFSMWVVRPANGRGVSFGKDVLPREPGGGVAENFGPNLRYTVPRSVIAAIKRGYFDINYGPWLRKSGGVHSTRPEGVRSAPPIANSRELSPRKGGAG